MYFSQIQIFKYQVTGIQFIQMSQTQIQIYLKGNLLKLA